MEHNRRFLTPLSLLLVVTLILPDVARAAEPLWPAQAVPERSPAPATTLPPWSVPATRPQAEATASPTASTPVGAQTGRLLLAPAIDADGDPASNPVASTPVPVIDLAGEVAGIVALAAQLEPDDPDAVPIGVPVTFRVWDAQGVQFEQTVRSDAWGAASVEVMLENVEGEYAYQANAPGYGETEVRRFRFDLAQASYTLHLDGAQLWYWRQGPGRVLFTLRSPVPLDADRDEVTLLAVRQPIDEGVWEEESPLQPVFEAIGEAGLGLPFPPVAMRVVGAYTATVEVQLPPGDYGFIGSLAINTHQAEHFYSQPMRLAVAHGAASSPAEAIWASPLEHEPGRTLVQYRASAGRAIFDLVPTDQVPEISDGLDGENLFVNVWRTGPFEWQEEVYEITVETLVDDGNKIVSLADFDYDPIARRYTLAIRSLHDETITDTLRVDVLGPGGVVIKHEDAQVVLEPGQVLHYSIEVPAELGQPEGLRVALDDPLLDYIRCLVRVGTTIVSAVSGRGSVTFVVRISATVLGYTLLDYTRVYPPGTWEGNFLPPPNVGKILKKLVAGLLSCGSLGSVEVDFSLNFTANFTVNPGPCPTAEGQARIEEILELLADDLDAMLDELDKLNPTFDVVKVRIWWILAVWISGSFGARGAARASGLTLSIDGGLHVGYSGHIGIKILLWSSKFGKAMRLYFHGINTLTDVLYLASAIERWQVPQDDCDPDPPDDRPPDDRQDVWQGIEGFYQGQTHDETIDNLTGLIERAQAHNLWRAERLLTLRLREAELTRFGSDMTTLDDYLDEIEAIETVAQTDLQGIISGTIPISPSQTITEALITRMEQAMADMEALPYARDQQQLLDAADVANMLYLELQGQELELQHELRQLLTADAVGVVAAGFAEATLSALEAAGLPAQLISPWPSGGEFRGRSSPYFPPDLAPRALVIPAGGLHAIAGSPEAREWLEAYVDGGGLLVVFTQAFGEEWAALPGGQVAGVGYEEDQRCQHASVEAAARSDWLVWMGLDRPDIQVDGAFTAWPENADVLLLRTRGRYAGHPAMIEYPYGEGTVLATVAYGDWAWQAGNWWGDDWQMTRSVLLRAWLLMRGQDVGDLFSADPDSDITVGFPLTNTGTFTATSAAIEIPVLRGWGSGVYVVNVPLSLPPGAGTVVMTTMRTPRVQRHVHSWTQVGLYRLKVTVRPERGGEYTTWGPVIYVHSPVALPELVGSLTTACTRATLFQEVTVTATVRSYVSVTRTVVVRGERDLPTDPVTLTVPPGGQDAYAYTVWMDGSKNPTVRFSSVADMRPERCSTLIQVDYPALQAEPVIPAVITDGASIPLRVSNMSQGAALAGSVALTLTAPSGVPVWTAAETLLPLAAGQTVTPTFALALPPLEHGVYHLWYRVDDGRGLSRATSVPLPARLATHLTSDRASYRIREPMAFTVTLRNAGRFALAPTVTVTVPAVSFTATQSLTLPAGEQAVLPFSLTLPSTLTTGTHDVWVRVFQGTTISQCTPFVVPESRVEAALEPGLYRAGETLTVTLRNEGGVDTTAAYILGLMGAGEEIARASGNVPVLAGAGTPITLSIPAQAATGENYALRADVQDGETGEARRWVWQLPLEGVSATVEARTERPAYLTSETITATGQVSLTSGALLSASLDLEVSGTLLGITVSPNVRVNDDITGTAQQEYPAVAADADGDAYAVWEDQRNSDDDIYFAYRPVTGAWGANVRVNDAITGTVWQRSPAIAVDVDENAYAVWEDRRNGDRDIYFAYRPAGGTWGTDVRVNDDITGTTWQESPDIAVDADGNAYAVWVDDRDSDDDIYFAYRPAGGTWEADVRLNDDITGTAQQRSPTIAVDADGNAYAVWEDRRNSNPDIYFAYRPAGGTWGPNVRVNDDGGTASQSVPDIAVDADGNAYTVWEDARYDSDIYFAYRPAGGGWGTNVRVNDDEGGTSKYHPAITVDAAGNVYAVWSFSIPIQTVPASHIPHLRRPRPSKPGTGAVEQDGNGCDGPNGICFAHRPAGGEWGENVRVDDEGTWPGSPAVAVDAAGRAHAVWEDWRDGSCDIYSAIIAPSDLLWSRRLTVTTATTWPISETVGTLGGRTGKFYLRATLENQLGQTLDRSSYPFYVYPAGTAITLQTDRAVYRPGQTILVSGRVTNTAALSATIPLTVTADGQTLLTDTLMLEPGEGAPYSTTLTATENVLLITTAGPAQVAEQVTVAAAQVEATLEAPQVIGRAPFSATLLVTNTGQISVALVADFAGQVTRTVMLESSAMALLQASLVITEDTLLTVTLSGDVSLALTQAITQGEVVTLSLGGGEANVRTGLVTLPYTLTGIGSLPAAVELSATLHSETAYTYTQSLVILPGQVYAGVLPLEVTPGAHQLRLVLYGALGNEMAQQEISLWAMATDAPEQPDATITEVHLSPQPVEAGRPLTVALTLRNEGAAGPAIVGLQVFDPEQQWIITPAGWLTQTFAFTLSVPADAPAGTYFGQASLDGESRPFTLVVDGVDVALALTLDQPWYFPGDVISLTATLTESAGLSDDYNLSLCYISDEDYVTVTLPAGQVVQHTFAFTATESGRASVILSYVPSASGQRVIMIDSLPVEVVRPEVGVYLTHDKSLYNAGDTIHLTATVTGTFGSVVVMGPMELALQDEGFLMWWSSSITEELGLVLTGTYPLSYTFPAQLRSGRYTFLVQAGGQSHAYPVDVRGWSVTARRFTLGRPRYAQEDTLSAMVEFVNEGDTPIQGLRLSAWVAPPQGERGLLLSPPVSCTVDLQPGLNVFTVTGAFTTSHVGPHRLVVNVGPGCCCGGRVAGAAAQFDVGWAHLVELTTDHGDYAPGEIGTGRLDVYGYGPTNLVVTATNGVTLLDVQPDLFGYDTLTFTIPTTPTGDYLLVATSSDQDGNTDSLVRAYAVPGPRDTQPPTLTLTYPSTDTIITTAAPTTTITVTGNAADDSGEVTVLVNGQVVTPTAGGDFSLPLEVHQGFNMVSAAALDPSWNTTYTPIVAVYLMPARGVVLSADRTEAVVGEQVTFQAILTASGVLSDAVQVQMLPAEMVTDVVAWASSGQASVGGFDPALQTVTWQGDLDGVEPVTVTVEATLVTSGTLTQTTTVYWGWGFIEESNAVEVNVVEWKHIYLPLVLR